MGMMVISVMMVMMVDMPTMGGDASGNGNVGADNKITDTVSRWSPYHILRTMCQTFLHSCRVSTSRNKKTELSGESVICFSRDPSEMVSK